MLLDHPMAMKSKDDRSFHGETPFERFEMAADELDASVSIITPLSSLGVATHSAYAEYEPVRYCGQAVAPQRFYRCFWRSITERILSRRKMCNVLRAND